MPWRLPLWVPRLLPPSLPFGVPGHVGGFAPGRTTPGLPPPPQALYWYVPQHYIGTGFLIPGQFPGTGVGGFGPRWSLSLRVPPPWGSGLRHLSSGKEVFAGDDWAMAQSISQQLGTASCLKLKSTSSPGSGLLNWSGCPFLPPLGRGPPASLCRLFPRTGIWDQIPPWG